MEKYFEIGNFCFRIIYEDGITIPKNFGLFEISEKKYEYTYEVSVGNVKVKPKGKQVAAREDLIVFCENRFESRYIGIKGSQGFYGCYEEIDDRNAKIIISNDVVQLLEADTIFSSLFALERRLLKKGGIILHCAYLLHEEEAILFTAPSGVGKSTQASLWEEYQNGKTMNGDRALLMKRDDKWFAFGWPVCGSSEICNNVVHPIKAIVILDRGEENQVSRINGAFNVKRLYTQVTVNYWNSESVLKIFDYLEGIDKDVVCFNLTCNISKEATEVLREAII